MQDIDPGVRIAELEGQVSQLEAEVQVLWKVVRGEVAMDGKTPMKKNPGKRSMGNKRTSPVYRRNLNRALAARARGLKPRGKGKGAVLTKAKQQELQLEAEQALAEVGVEEAPPPRKARNKR